MCGCTVCGNRGLPPMGISSRYRRGEEHTLSCVSKLVMQSKVEAGAGKQNPPRLFQSIV